MRVYAKTRFVWVREQPSWSAPWLGYLFPGESVALKSLKPVYAWGCEVWYEVMPEGYVCVDGKRATLDPDDGDYRTVAAYTPNFSTPVLHRYAESLGAERYESLPTHEEQRARESDLRHHLKMLRLARGGAPLDPSLEGVDISLPSAEAVPFGARKRNVHALETRIERRATTSEPQHLQVMSEIRFAGALLLVRRQ